MIYMKLHSVTGVPFKNMSKEAISQNLRGKFHFRLNFKRNLSFKAPILPVDLSMKMAPFSSEHMILTFVDKIKKQKIRKTKNSAISNNNLGAKTFQTIKWRRCIKVDRMHPSCRIE